VENYNLFLQNIIIFLQLFLPVLHAHIHMNTLQSVHRRAYICVYDFLTKRGACFCKRRKEVGISLCNSAIWKSVIIKGKV